MGRRGKMVETRRLRVAGVAVEVPMERTTRTAFPPDGAMLILTLIAARQPMGVVNGEIVVRSPVNGWLPVEDEMLAALEAERAVAHEEDRVRATRAGRALLGAWICSRNRGGR